MSLAFEWGEDKAEENLRKHGVGFEEAKSIFNDPFSITIYDHEHSIDEGRYVDIDLSLKGGLIVVPYTERGENIRIISRRRTTKKEQKDYEEK